MRAALIAYAWVKYRSITQQPGLSILAVQYAQGDRVRYRSKYTMRTITDICRRPSSSDPFLWLHPFLGDTPLGVREGVFLAVPQCQLL